MTIGTHVSGAYSLARTRSGKDATNTPYARKTTTTIASALHNSSANVPTGKSVGENRSHLDRGSGSGHQQKDRLDPSGYYDHDISNGGKPAPKHRTRSTSQQLAYSQRSSRTTTAADIAGRKSQEEMHGQSLSSPAIVALQHRQSQTYDSRKYYETTFPRSSASQTTKKKPSPRKGTKPGEQSSNTGGCEEPRLKKDGDILSADDPSDDGDAVMEDVTDAMEDEPEMLGNEQRWGREPGCLAVAASTGEAQDEEEQVEEIEAEESSPVDDPQERQGSKAAGVDYPFSVEAIAAPATQALPDQPHLNTVTGMAIDPHLIDPHLDVETGPSHHQHDQQCRQTPHQQRAASPPASSTMSNPDSASQVGFQNGAFPDQSDRIATASGDGRQYHGGGAEDMDIDDMDEIIGNNVPQVSLYPPSSQRQRPLKRATPRYHNQASDRSRHSYMPAPSTHGTAAAGLDASRVGQGVIPPTRVATAVVGRDELRAVRHNERRGTGTSSQAEQRRQRTPSTEPEEGEEAVDEQLIRVSRLSGKIGGINARQNNHARSQAVASAGQHTDMVCDEQGESSVAAARTRYAYRSLKDRNMQISVFPEEKTANDQFGSASDDRHPAIEASSSADMDSDHSQANNSTPDLIEDEDGMSPQDYGRHDRHSGMRYDRSEDNAMGDGDDGMAESSSRHRGLGHGSSEDSFFQDDDEPEGGYQPEQGRVATPPRRGNYGGYGGYGEQADSEYEKGSRRVEAPHDAGLRRRSGVPSWHHGRRTLLPDRNLRRGPNGELVFTDIDDNMLEMQGELDESSSHFGNNAGVRLQHMMHAGYCSGSDVYARQTLRDRGWSSGRTSGNDHWRGGYYPMADSHQSSNLMPDFNGDPNIWVLQMDEEQQMRFVQAQSLDLSPMKCWQYAMDSAAISDDIEWLANAAAYDDSRNASVADADAAYIVEGGVNADDVHPDRDGAGRASPANMDNDDDNTIVEEPLTDDGIAIDEAELSRTPDGPGRPELGRMSSAEPSHPTASEAGTTAGFLVPNFLRIAKAHRGRIAPQQDMVDNMARMLVNSEWDQTKPAYNKAGVPDRSDLYTTTHAFSRKYAARGVSETFSMADILADVKKNWRVDKNRPLTPATPVQAEPVSKTAADEPASSQPQDLRQPLLTMRGGRDPQRLLLDGFEIQYSSDKRISIMRKGEASTRAESESEDADDISEYSAEEQEVSVPTSHELEEAAMQNVRKINPPPRKGNAM